MGLSNKKSHTVSTSHSGSFTHNPAESPKTPGIVSSILWFTQCPPDMHIEDAYFQNTRYIHIQADCSYSYSCCSATHWSTFNNKALTFIPNIWNSLLFYTNMAFIVFLFSFMGLFSLLWSAFHPSNCVMVAHKGSCLNEGFGFDVVLLGSDPDCSWAPV